MAVGKLATSANGGTTAGVAGQQDYLGNLLGMIPGIGPALGDIGNLAGQAGQAGANADQLAYQRKLMQKGISGTEGLFNTPAPMLNQIQSDITKGATQAQQQQVGQEKLALAQQGVQGPQSATAVNRSSGQMNLDLQNQLDQLSYNDYTRRQSGLANMNSQLIGGGK